MTCFVPRNKTTRNSTYSSNPERVDSLQETYWWDTYRRSVWSRLYLLFTFARSQWFV